jgi:hypothetical protein
MYGYTRCGEARDQFLEMAAPTVGFHGCCCLFECIYRISTDGLSTLSLSFAHATNLGLGTYSHRRNLPAEALIPTVF